VSRYPFYDKFVGNSFIDDVSYPEHQVVGVPLDISECRDRAKRIRKNYELTITLSKEGEDHVDSIEFSREDCCCGR
jgi:hypothetical protein